MKILIVDDSRAMQNIVAKSMRAIGYQQDSFLFADNGETALETVAEEKPDLILSDLHMPTMDGLALVKALRAKSDSTKLIIVSIDDSEKAIDAAKVAGADAYLTKPFTSEQLFTTVSSVAGQSENNGNGRMPVKAQEVLPGSMNLARVLSSLVQDEVDCKEASFGELDFLCGPYYGATLRDNQHNIICSLFFDAVAANAIVSIMKNLHPRPASELPPDKHLKGSDHKLFMGFVGVFTGLCKPLPTGELLDIHAEQYAKDPEQHLKAHMLKYVDSTTVFALSSGSKAVGKFLASFPQAQ